MRTLQTGVLLFVCVPLLLTAHQPSASGPDDRFMALAGQFVRESLALVPSSASAAGYHEHRDARTGRTVALDAVLDDFSPSGFDAQARFYREWRGRFSAIPQASLGSQAAADWQLVDDQFALQLLETDRIRNARHNPTAVVEAIGTALFLPLTQEYAPLETRLAHVLSRLEQVPRAFRQARDLLLDADPVFIRVAAEENDGNIDLIETTIRGAIPGGSALAARYAAAAPPAVTAARQFNDWLRRTLAGRPTDRTWRLGPELYAQKFKYVLGASTSPAQVLADAEAALAATRDEMARLAGPLHADWFPDHGDHANLAGVDRQNTVIGEVLRRISDEHPSRDGLLDAVSAGLEAIRGFVREQHVVGLGPRDNLQVIPTPPFMRGIYSVAGFHPAPPLEPTARAEYWVTPIDPTVPADRAESKLREYNDWVLQWLTIHEALPGHYVQFEHANDVQPETRRLLRSLFGSGPYVEGWAEYVTDVMVDKGFADRDPRFVISRKKVWLRAIANAILDVRLQTMGMTDEEALELMETRCFQTKVEAEGKLQRAKLSSAQLPTYFVGARQWWQLRKRYEARTGSAFDLERFHDRALDLGPLPLTLVEQLLFEGQ